jgi:hypothetical protein
MRLEDIKQDWRAEMDRTISATETHELFNAMQQRYFTMKKSIHGRDIREILAAILVVAAFAAMWPIYRKSSVAVLGVAVICAGAVLITCVLLSARRTAPLPFGGSVIEFSRNRLDWLDGQIRLLRTVAWWYVAPLFVGCLLFTWGITGGAWLAFAFQALVTVAVAAWIIAQNQRAVLGNLQPVRDELARFIDVLEDDERNGSQP